MSHAKIFGVTIFLFCFFMNGNTKQAQCALLESASLRKRKRKAMKRINKLIKYFKKKKIMPSGS